jgi:hypothetical protein
MVFFNTVIEKFADQGSNTGWTYILVPFEVAEQLNPNSRKAFRIRGRIDSYFFKAKSLMPYKEGNYFLALNAEMRKGINKLPGSKIEVEIEVDPDPIPLSEDLLLCLRDEPRAFEFFQSLTKSHQKYFSDWVETAKTMETKEKRIAQSVTGLSMKLSFGEMIRANRENRLL